MEEVNTTSGHSDSYRQYNDHLNQPLSVGDWFITILIAAIPIVGFVMLFVWSFSSDTNVSKSNWAKATLLWYVVSIVIAGIIMSFVGFAFIADQFNF